MSNYVENQPRIRGNRSNVVSTVVLILLLTTSLFAVFPLVNAHTPAWQVPTFAYITAQPNPVGVNQQMFVVFWLDLPPPTAGGSGGDRWHNFTITVIAPDGTTQTLGPFTSDPTGGTYTMFTPTQTGTYTFNLQYSGQVLQLDNPITGTPGLDSLYINDTFLPSNATCSLTVQQSQVIATPENPLPTGYWQRPINQQNSAWASIASNWVGVYQDYRVQDGGIAPTSAHILWTMPIEFGGIVGGTNTGIPEAGYYTGMSYEDRFTNALILQGRLYFNMPLADNPTAGPYTCIDLSTGKILWQQSGISPTFAQLYDYESPNQHGVIPSGTLFQSVGGRGTPETWMAFDPFTGVWMYNLTNIPSGTNVYQPDGSIARYILHYDANTHSGWLAKWTTAALTSSPLVLTPGTTTNAWQYRPLGKNADMSNNYQWNVTINGDLTGSQPPSIVSVLPGDILLGTSSNVATTALWRGSPNPWTMWAISLKSNSLGQIMWKQDYPAPPNNESIMYGYQPIDSVNRVFTMTIFETGQRLGYSLDTGNLLWGPVGTPYQQADAYQYFSSRAGQEAYGELIVGGYGGSVFAYNTTNGDKVWNFNDTYAGFDSPWGMTPTFVSMMADGMVFAVGGEHSPNVPLYKNEKLYAINAYNGQEVWNLTAFAASGLGEGYAFVYVADGKLLFYNEYDSQIYCIGQGLSATTVTATPGVNNAITIQGTVTDQSPGQTCLGIPAAGTPAIADKYMSAWMEYLYEQSPEPMNATGVPVTLTATGPNGVTQNIGTVTSDITGSYAVSWTPPTSGVYTITASFAGSNSYYSSSAETHIAVGSASSAASPAPTSTPSAAPAPTQGPLNETYIIAAAVVVIIAIIAAVAVALRRRRTK